MKIVHRISISTTPDIRRELAELGVTVREGLATFEVDEAHPTWPGIESWVARRGALDMVSTRFSAEEIAEAPWVAVLPAWHWEYPQPEDEYLEVTYDLSGYCRQCGIGAVQKAPFRMKSEPRWGKNEILQLNWVFGEYFVKPALWKDVFEPRGVGSRPVLDMDGKRELKTVVQLATSGEAVVEMGSEAPTRCASCGRAKYLPHVRGPFPRVARVPAVPLARTEQWFGSGASAYQVVLASRELVRALSSRKVRGVSFKPTARQASPTA